MWKIPSSANSLWDTSTSLGTWNHESSSFSWTHPQIVLTVIASLRRDPSQAPRSKRKFLLESISGYFQKAIIGTLLMLKQREKNQSTYHYILLADFRRAEICPPGKRETLHGHVNWDAQHDHTMSVHETALDLNKGEKRSTCQWETELYK